ncbi:MAG: O-antigen ligase family protein [Hyphomicrobium sp.]
MKPLDARTLAAEFKLVQLYFKNIIRPVSVHCLCFARNTQQQVCALRLFLTMVPKPWAGDAHIRSEAACDASVMAAGLPKVEEMPQRATTEPLEPPLESATPPIIAARWIIWVALAVLPCLHFSSMADAAGFPRWTLLTATTALAVLLIAFSCRWPERKALSLTGLPAPLKWLAVLVVASALSTLDSTDPQRSAIALTHLLAGSILSYCVFHLADAGWYRTLAWTLVLPIAFNAPLIILQYHGVHDTQIASLLGVDFVTVDYFGQVAPPAGTFVNCNLAASWLATTLPLASYLIIAAKVRFGAVFAALLLAVGLEALLATGSRTGWLAVSIAGSVAILAAVASPPIRRAVSGLLTPTKALLLVAALALPIGGEIASTVFGSGGRIAQRMQGAFTHDTQVTLAGELAAEFPVTSSIPLDPRVAFTVNSLRMAADNPLTGVGLGAFGAAYPHYQNAVLPHPVADALHSRLEQAHSDLVQALAETGVPGALALIALFWSTLVAALRKAAEPAASDPAQAYFLSLSITALAVAATGDFPLQTATAFTVLMVLVGMVSGLTEKMPAASKATSDCASADTSRRATLALRLATFALVVVTAWTEAHRWLGHQHATVAVRRMSAGQYDRITCDAIEAALTASPADPYAGYLRGIAYANFDGGPTGDEPLPPERLIEVLEVSTRYDRAFPLNVGNLGGAYYEKALINQFKGDHAEGKKLAPKMRALYRSMLRAVPRRPETWTLGGLAYLADDKPATAALLFGQALRLDARNRQALLGREYARQRAARRPVLETAVELRTHPRLRLARTPNREPGSE